MEVGLPSIHKHGETRRLKPRNDKGKGVASTVRGKPLSKGPETGEDKEWGSEPEYAAWMKTLPAEEQHNAGRIWLIQKALEYYNKTHGVNYVLVENKGTSDSWMWNHVNFIARRAAPSHSQPELFFAEMFGNPVRYFINMCFPVDLSDPKLVRGCILCERDVLHPDPATGYELADFAGWERRRKRLI